MVYDNLLALNLEDHLWHTNYTFYHKLVHLRYHYYYSTKLQRKIFYEWTLIEGKNDSVTSAHAVGKLLQGQPAQVNLIPLNPTSGYGGAPTGQEAARRFQQVLADYGLPSTVRQRRGIDIAAGCGQLAAIK